jgi:hypothetical protein
MTRQQQTWTSLLSEPLADADFLAERPTVTQILADRLAQYDPSAPYAGEVWAEAQPVGNALVSPIWRRRPATLAGSRQAAHIIRYLRHRARRRKHNIRGLELARMMGMTLPMLKLKSLAGMPWGVTTMWWEGGMEIAMRLTPIRYARKASFSAHRPHFWRNHKGRVYAMKERRKGERRHRPKPGSAFEWRQLDRKFSGKVICGR